MATVNTVYTGELRTEATHEKSGVMILTDAPTDNHGKGESFSPTDLLAASLGSCMLTVVGIEARKQGFSIDGTRVSILKRMASDPRRVSAIHVKLYFPDTKYTGEQIQLIKHTALNCPVALSLHPDLEQHVEFYFHNEPK